MRERILCGRLREDGTQCRGEMAPSTTLFGEVVLLCGVCGREERIVRRAAEGVVSSAAGSGLPGQTDGATKPTRCVDCGSPDLHARGRCQPHYLVWWRQQQQQRKTAQGGRTHETVAAGQGAPDDGNDGK